jgi:hypothetical protein
MLILTFYILQTYVPPLIFIREINYVFFSSKPNVSDVARQIFENLTAKRTVAPDRLDFSDHFDEKGR